MPSRKVTFGSLKIGDKFRILWDGHYLKKIEPKPKSGHNAIVCKYPKDQTTYVPDDLLVFPLPDLTFSF